MQPSSCEGLTTHRHHNRRVDRAAALAAQGGELRHRWRLHEVKLRQARTGVGAGIVAASEPHLDVGAVEGVAVGAHDGVAHDIVGYGAHETDGHGGSIGHVPVLSNR
jgi:hypothetical protein